MIATCFSHFILNNFVNFNSINLKFGEIIKTYELYLPCKFGKNPSRRTWVMNLQIFPIHSYDKIAYSFLTTCTRRCWTWHWGNVVAKIRSLHVFLTHRRADLHGGKLFGDRTILSLQNCVSSSITIPLLKLLPLITVVFPVLSHLYLGILEEYSLRILCTKLGNNN